MGPRPSVEGVGFWFYPTIGSKKGQFHGSATLRTLAAETNEFSILHGGGTRQVGARGISAFGSR
jgi:hypothetical protein